MLLVPFSALFAGATCIVLGVVLAVVARRVPPLREALRDGATAQCLLGAALLLRMAHPTLEYGPMLVLCTAGYAGHAAWVSMSVIGLRGHDIPRARMRLWLGGILGASVVGFVAPPLALDALGLAYVGIGLLYGAAGASGTCTPVTGVSVPRGPLLTIAVAGGVAALGLIGWGCAMIAAPDLLLSNSAAPWLAGSILLGALLNLIANCSYLLAVLGTMLEQIELHANSDPLTGALNRRGLDRHFERRRPRPGLNETGTLGLIAIDIDDFRRVNDEHGHAGGDAVLSECAARLRGLLRRHDALTRMGGEAFLVVVEGIQSADLQTLAARMQQAIAAEPVTLPGGLRQQVSISVGLGMAPAGRGRPDAGILQADQALCKARAAGREREALAA